MATVEIDHYAGRCFRCLDRYPECVLTERQAACGCAHRYCPDCLRSPRLWAWLGFVARSCVKNKDAA